jgi:hypothetical protein
MPETDDKISRKNLKGKEPYVTKEAKWPPADAEVSRKIFPTQFGK